MPFFSFLFNTFGGFQSRIEQIRAGFGIESDRKSKTNVFLSDILKKVKAEKLYSAGKYVTRNANIK